MLTGIARFRRAVKRGIIFNRFKQDETVEVSERRSTLRSVLGEPASRMIIGKSLDPEEESSTHSFMKEEVPPQQNPYIKMK